jgi:hypothetical protein
MTPGAMIFMGASWVFVLGLMFWSFGKVLQKQKHHDPDSLGPAVPPERGSADGIMPPPSDH